MSENILDLPIEEQIDLIIGQFSGHERIYEVADILATLASYEITGDDYADYYCELAIEEIKERIENGILTDTDWELERNSWEVIIHALGVVTVFEVLDNWKKYVDISFKIESLLSETKKHLYKDFLFERLERR